MYPESSSANSSDRAVEALISLEVARVSETGPDLLELLKLLIKLPIFLENACRRRTRKNSRKTQRLIHMSSSTVAEKKPRDAQGHSAG